MMTAAPAVNLSSGYISATDTAKLLRVALAKVFPGVTFSVRSKSYAGGASIDVAWTDGPPSRRVKPIIIEQIKAAGPSVAIKRLDLADNPARSHEIPDTAERERLRARWRAALELGKRRSRSGNEWRARPKP